MQPSSSMNDYIHFKDEIMKRIRLLENKFSSDLNSKLSKINESLEKLSIRIINVSENNNSLLGMITKNNYNEEKLAELGNFKAKAEQGLITHDIKIKNIIQEMEKLRIKYDKIINENLIVSGYIGPGGLYKNLAEYIQYQIDDFQKVKNDTDQTKNKVDNSVKSALNLVNVSFAQFQKYTNDKNKETQVMIEKKYSQFLDKILELETELNKYQYKIERQIKPMQGDIQKLINIRNEPTLTNKKNLKDIEQKVNTILKEFDDIKLNNNKELANKFYNYNQANNSTMLLNTKNTSHNKNKGNNSITINNELNNNSNFLSSFKKFRKNSSNKMLMSSENNRKDSFINISELQKLNKDNISSTKSIFSKKYNKNINFENDKETNNNEHHLKENKFSTDNNNNHDNNNNNHNNNNNNNHNHNNNNENQNNRKEDNIKNNDVKENENNNNSLEKNKNKFVKISINKNKENDKNQYIDKEKDEDNLSQIKFQENNNNKNNKKISIDALYTQKKFSMSDSLININSNKERKDEELENNFINSVNKKKILSNENSENKKYTINKKNVNNLIINNNNNKSESINNKLNIINSDNFNSNKNNINTKLKNINNNLNNLKNFSENNNHIFLNKKEGSSSSNDYQSIKKNFFNLQMNINEEQKQIMKKIREYYNNKKMIMEKKFKENAVDCNVINLNSNNISDIINVNYKNPSAKSTFFTSSKSNINENRNNLKKISIQTNTLFRRTSYRHFRKKDNNNNIKCFNSFDNKICLDGN